MEQIICSWEIANWHFERKNCFLTASCEVLREFPMIAKTSVFIVVWCLCDACENCESVVWKKQWFSAAPVPKFWFGSVRIKGAKTGLLLVSCSFKAYYNYRGNHLLDLMRWWILVAYLTSEKLVLALVNQTSY